MYHHHAVSSQAFFEQRLLHCPTLLATSLHFWQYNFSAAEETEHECWKAGLLAKMRLHDQIFSEEDFEQLPQALQRKVSGFFLLSRYQARNQKRLYHNSNHPPCGLAAMQTSTNVDDTMQTEAQPIAYPQNVLWNVHFVMLTTLAAGLSTGTMTKSKSNDEGDLRRKGGPSFRPAMHPPEF